MFEILISEAVGRLRQNCIKNESEMENNNLRKGVRE